jgi:hypothetical protein
MPKCSHGEERTRCRWCKDCGGSANTLTQDWMGYPTPPDIPAYTYTDHSPAPDTSSDYSSGGGDFGGGGASGDF